MRKFVLFGVLALVPIIFVVKALNTDVSLGAQTTASASPTAATGQSQSTEVEILRAQLEQMRTFDERLLQTVYWSLAGAVTAVVAGGGLLVGFGWFANMRLYERDKTALQNELQTQVTNESTKLETQVRERTGAIGETVRAVIRDEFGLEVRQLREELRLTQVDLLRIQAEQWEARSAPEQALIVYLRMWDILQEMQQHGPLASTLESVRRILGTGISLDAALSHQLAKMLDALPGDFAIQAETISQAMQRSESGRR